jgi:hypothetical protein
MSDSIFSELFVGETLLKWQVAHELSVRLRDEGLIVSDSPQYNWHLLRWHAAELVYRLVRVKCVLKVAPAATVNFYVHHFGSLDVAEINFDGTIVNNGISRYITVSKADDGSLEIELEFLNCDAVDRMLRQSQPHLSWQRPRAVRHCANRSRGP